MLAAHVGLGVGCRFVRPVTEDGLAELAEFLDHAFLGGVGIGAVGDGLVQCVDDVVQAGEQLGPVRQALFERALGFGNAGGQCRFIIHEPFYLYSG